MSSHRRVNGEYFHSSQTLTLYLRPIILHTTWSRSCGVSQYQELHWIRNGDLSFKDWGFQSLSCLSPPLHHQHHSERWEHWLMIMWRRQWMLCLEWAAHVCRATLENDVPKFTWYDQVAGWMQLGIHWPLFYLKPELAVGEVHAQCMGYQRRVDWWKFAWWVSRHFITHVPPVYPLLLLMLATHHLVSLTRLIWKVAEEGEGVIVYVATSYMYISPHTAYRQRAFGLTGTRSVSNTSLPLLVEPMKELLVKSNIASGKVRAQEQKAFSNMNSPYSKPHSVTLWPCMTCRHMSQKIPCYLASES